ncbi:ARM repeat-containing protein [Venustampulla echinocandica]|uniref:ARM repeat-containing protein n=1 Tax=Venustampulla echinocandica TaxID=2656787 RepID=A0A370TNZ3_9HELO|nr:ARM repeat-containing protein [Venustampulla echinocandica]RDL37240.1 ARM repeat-containing protein [Venustampulla echinocandica]
MFTIASTPAKQSVSETISTLASRLSSSTLLEDRRAAILGLRSFAKEYPASVASDALRGLIASLTKDGEDVDTVKVVLETLLMLFSPNENSPEASEEIALWLADEFTQRQDNITLLLDFLDTNDFYSRLYSLQLLSHILASRTERTEECIFTAPLGISRLVAVLDDRKEAVRNEALSLLTYLTPSSSELQKLVAFENVFDRIFSIIKLEGSLSHGDRIVEDCLILLANLLRLNVSNQSFFRETGCVPKLARLLKDALGDEGTEEEVAEWAKVQRNRNIYALLAVLRLFLVTGGVGTRANQASFWQHGVVTLVLQLAFNRSTEMQIKSEALITCADLIRDNPSLQESFAQLQVTSVLDEPVDESSQASQQNGIPKVYVIDGLLDLTLSVPSLSAFDSRLAACECIKAYFFNHPAIRKHFLRRAIDGHTSGADETANVLTTLLQPLDSHVSSDPYRYWLAAVIIFHLIYEDPDAKSLAMSVSEGDSSTGEEVVTCIQTIAANLIIGIQKNVDERVLVAYLMLLCGWLFEDPDGVNDFLGEGSNIQSLIQAALHTGPEGVLVPGLCAMLLGIIYEFSTKDSPVPRETIHSILASRLGRDQYIDRLMKWRGHPLLRDFEVLPQKLSSAPQGGLPDVFFDKTFVEFVKDNFSRMLRAIDRDPGFEVPVIANGVTKGISREMVDSLRSQLEEKTKALEKAEDELLSTGRQLGQDQADHRRAKETFNVELTRIKNVNDSLQRHHDDEMNKIRADQEKVAQDHQRQLEHVQKTNEANAERTRKRMEAEISDLKSNISKLEADLSKANKNHLQDLQTAHDEYTANQKEQTARLQRAEEKAKEAEERGQSASKRATTAESALVEKEKEKQAIQSELDDLLMVFGDLEDKVTKYKDRLKELGESVSEAEDDDEDGDEDADDDDDNVD